MFPFVLLVVCKQCAKMMRPAQLFCSEELAGLLGGGCCFSLIQPSQRVLGTLSPPPTHTDPSLQMSYWIRPPSPALRSPLGVYCQPHSSKPGYVAQNVSTTCGDSQNARILSYAPGLAGLGKPLTQNIEIHDLCSSRKTREDDIKMILHV